jgi:hypothetical protein
MQREKTRFEQVPVAVAEKVLQQATVLASARRTLGTGARSRGRISRAASEERGKK